MDSIFEKVKSAINIAEVVTNFGVQLNSSDKALCPFHKEKTPSFSIKREDNTFKCFGCGISGDSIDFTAKFNDVDLLEAAKILADIYHIDIADKALKLQKINIKNYIEKCKLNINKTDYFLKRGLLEEIIKQFSLGYDENKKSVVMPYNSKLNYYQTRNIDTKAFFKPKTEDAGTEPIFLEGMLYNIKKEVVFVVESPICALSIIQCGSCAIAICGTSGGNKLIKLLKIKPSKNILIVCLDNDEPGQKASLELGAQLAEIKIKYVIYNIADNCKDPNELLMKDPEQLKKNIEKAKKEAKKKYLSDKDSFSAAELQKTDIKDPNWLINDVLPEGLAILSAPSKAGKSWMMLQMCLAIANERDFLDFKTCKSGCLYLALEDSKGRLKDRLNKILKNEKAPENLHLSLKADPLDGGLIEQIENEINSYPEIRLVVIDTLQKVRAKFEKAESMYSSDYREMAKFKEYADKKNICILLVHHVRKMKDESDIFNSISGSNGIMGACDTIFVISKKKRGDEEATLSMTGRDIKQESFVIMFNKESYKWEVVGTEEEMEKKRKKQEYESSPIVKTIKTMIEKSPLGWKSTSTEFMNAIFDVTGQQYTDSGLGLSNSIKAIENQLYYDGIEHKAGKTGSKRYHSFIKKSRYNSANQQSIENLE